MQEPLFFVDQYYPWKSTLQYDFSEQTSCLWRLHINQLKVVGSSIKW